jgi:hypothetical protein
MLIAGDVGGTKPDRVRTALQTQGARDSGAYAVHVVVTPAALAGATAYGFEIPYCASPHTAPSNGRRSKSSEDSEIHDPDVSPHLVLPARREIHREIGDIAGFDADHLDPLIIRKIGHGT